MTDVESPTQVGIDRIKLFPNPAKDQITVQTNFPVSLKYNAVDIAGRKITSGEIPVSEKSHLISLSDFEPGIYLLILMNNRELIDSRKFIVY